MDTNIQRYETAQQVRAVINRHNQSTNEQGNVYRGDDGELHFQKYGSTIARPLILL